MEICGRQRIESDLLFQKMLCISKSTADPKYRFEADISACSDSEPGLGFALEFLQVKISTIQDY
jgi:hypothetical protein